MASENRKVEQLEERLRDAEQELAALTSNLQIINDNLKENIERTRNDLRDRISELKKDIKVDFDQVDSSLSDLNDTINVLNSSLQNLYITQSGSNIKVNFNEKLIWSVVTLLGTGALYLVQELITVAGAG